MFYILLRKITKVMPVRVIILSISLSEERKTFSLDQLNDGKFRNENFVAFVPSNLVTVWKTKSVLALEGNEGNLIYRTYRWTRWRKEIEIVTILCSEKWRWLSYLIPRNYYAIYCEIQAKLTSGETYNLKLSSARHQLGCQLALS